MLSSPGACISFLNQTRTKAQKRSMIVKNYIIDPGQTQLLRRYKTERQHNDKRTSNKLLKIYLSLMRHWLQVQVK